MSGATQAQRFGLLCCATCVMLLGAALAAGLRVDHSAAIQWYDRQIVTHPLRTKALTAGLIGALGDLICQHFVEERQAETLATVAQAGGTLKARLAKPIISWSRAARFVTCGCCLSGPVYHFWFQLLSEHFPKPSTAILLGMVAADQLLLAPPFNTLFLSVLYGLEALELHGFGLLCVRTVRGRVLGSWCDVMKMNYSALHATSQCRPTKCLRCSRPRAGIAVMWLPAQTVNFMLVPDGYHVLFMNLLGVFWTILLSMRASSASTELLVIS